MQITIQEKKENVLLSRLEVKGKIKFTGVTPSNVQLIESLAKELKTEPNLLVVKNIYTIYGQQEATFLVYLYKDVAARKKAEVVTSHMKKKAEEEQKKAAEAKKEGGQ